MYEIRASSAQQACAFEISLSPTTPVRETKQGSARKSYTRVETFGYGYQAEIICDLLLYDKSYLHVEINNSDRQWGASKAFALTNFVSVANSLFHILIRRIQGKII